MIKKHQYSPYQVKRAMKKKVVQISDRTYLVNDEHIVIDNQKNLRCNCKWASDNKLHVKYCSCCLAVLHTIDREMFWAEIYGKGIKNNKFKNIKQ